MKRVLLTAILACFALGVFGVSAQERGGFAVGPRVSFYTHAGTGGAMVGVGAIGRYSLTRHWRLEPGVSALCERGCSIDANFDVHYLLHLLPVWTFYPAVGIGANDIGKWSFGVNLGAGTDFSLTRRWDLTAGVKWMLQSAEFHKNPLVITVGATYKF